MGFWMEEEQRGFTTGLEVLVYGVWSGKSCVVYDSVISRFTAEQVQFGTPLKLMWYVVSSSSKSRGA